MAPGCTAILAAQSIGSTIVISRRTFHLIRSGMNETLKFLLAGRCSSAHFSVSPLKMPFARLVDFRTWHLHALNVRTNHIPIVVSIGSIKPERALSAFKANATRQMREDGAWQKESSPWAEKGSKRYLWTEQSIAKSYGVRDEWTRR